MARGRKTSLVISLSQEERRELESWQRSTTVRAGLARRGRIILFVAEGMSISEVARTVRIQRPHVYKWAHRFAERRIAGLYDKPGRGRKPFSPTGGRRASRKDGLRAA